MIILQREKVGWSMGVLLIVSSSFFTSVFAELLEVTMSWRLSLCSVVRTFFLKKNWLVLANRGTIQKGEASMPAKLRLAAPNLWHELLLIFLK